MRHTLLLGCTISLFAFFTCRAPAAPPAKKPAADAGAKAEVKKETEKAATKKPAAKKKTVPKTKTVVRFTLKGDFPEGPQSEGLFGELQPTLGTIIRRIDQAAKDPKVAAVWLRIGDLDVGRGKIHELRAAIARLRKARKPVYAELISAEPAEYMVASACNEIFMPESGTLLLPGVRAEVTFYKGLLEKLGIRFEMLQIGKYKGATEPFSRTEMSGPLRESMEALVDDAYDDMARIIGADRGMKDYRVKTLIDRGLFTAAAAQKAGLIDRVQYADQFRESLCKKLGAGKLDLVTSYKKKKVEVDFSGFSGMMKMMEMIMGGKPETKPSGNKKIALVYAVGTIIEGKSTTDIFGLSALGSTTLAGALRKADEDDKVVAVVLRVDSPGGSAVGSDLVWRQIVLMKKPVIASMGDVAGSGGYYIAMGADEIFAEPGTITGSIGVAGGKLVLGGLYDKVGLKTEVISRGAMSGSFSSTEPFTPEQRKAWMGLLQDTYRQFVRKAAEGRKMTVQEMGRVAQGRVWSGRMAKEKGLVDNLGTLQDAIAAAKKAAGLKKDEEVELMILPRPKTIFETLFGDPSDDLESAMPEVIKTLRRTKLYRRLLAEPTLMWMPYEVELK